MTKSLSHIVCDQIYTSLKNIEADVDQWKYNINYKYWLCFLVNTLPEAKRNQKKSTFCNIFDLTQYFKNLLQHIINLNVLKILGPLYFLLSLKSQVIFTSVTSQFGPVAFQRLGNPYRCYHTGQQWPCQYLLTLMLYSRKALKIYARCSKNIHCDFVIIIYLFWVFWDDHYFLKQTENAHK